MAAIGLPGQLGVRLLRQGAGLRPLPAYHGRVADDFEVVGVLDTLNHAGQGTWHLVCRLGGGRKTGAWVAEDRNGVRAVLKWHSSASTRRDLDGTAALMARARARGWPTPAWLASALFDWCVFATSGWEPEVVTAYLLKAASLFERLS